MRFTGEENFRHAEEHRIGILLVNLGTPEAATAGALRPYLKQFLSDPRVVEAPRVLWWLILHGIVLPFRSGRSAAAYRKIWTDAGSPLLVNSIRQCEALAQSLAPMRVALGMNYGEPSIIAALQKLKAQNCRHLLVLPLYPQYAGSTIGSVFDAVVREISRWRWVPHFRFISGYVDHPRYIEVLANSVAEFQRRHGVADRLIFSFHGTPLKMLQAGDPYHCLCHKTARLTATQLRLDDSRWQVTFQSRFGREVWLQPYTDETLRALPEQGVKRVQVVCPAFSADCLETLEEIAEENREIYLSAGGEEYAYIPALNDDEAHIQFLCALIEEATDDWKRSADHNNASREQQESLHQTLKTRPFYSSR